MRRTWLLACALSVAFAHIVLGQPDTFGAPANGVRLGIEIHRSPAAELWVTAQNVDDKPLLLPLGSLIGAGQYDFRFKVVLTTPDGRDRSLIYTGGPGIVAGRLDPLVIPLLPKASYKLRIPLALFYAVDVSERLEAFLHAKGRLRVELDDKGATCPLYGPPNPNMIPCWEGKVVSNILQLPR